MFLLVACEYAPNGSHFEELNPEPKFQATLNLDIAGDTVFIRGRRERGFYISLPRPKIYEYEVSLGNELLQKDDQSFCKIIIHSDQFKNGYHPLKLLVRASSGTGSLGDVSGAEMLEVYRTWMVEIRNGNPNPVQFTELYEKEGRLRIEWEN